MANVLKVGDLVMAGDKYFYVTNSFNKNNYAEVVEVSYDEEGNVVKGKKQMVEETIDGEKVSITPITLKESELKKKTLKK